MERVGCLLHAGEVAGPPVGVADVVVVLSGPAVDQLADDVGMPGVLGGLGEHLDQQGAGGGVAAMLWPPWHVAGCGQAEFADGLI